MASIDRKALRGAGLKAGKITLNSEADGLAAVRGSEIEEEFFDDVVENTVEEDNLHAENEIELNPVEFKDVNQADGMIAFVTPGFSVFGLIYTVDFEYSVDGKMYQFSLPGGGFVSLTDLIEVLGIPGDTSDEDNEEKSETVEARDSIGTLDVTAGDAAKKFVADIASVEFSSPELVWVGKADHETVHFGIRKLHGAGGTGGVFCSQDDKRLLQREGASIHTDLLLFHHFQKRSLGLRRRPVDLIRQEQIGENRTLLKDHGVLFPVVHRKAQDIRRQDVRGKLKPLKT